MEIKFKSILLKEVNIMDYKAWIVRPENLIEYESMNPPRKITPIINNKSCGARNLSASFFKLQPGNISKNDIHKEEEVYYVINGRAKLTIGEKSFLVEKGMVVFIPPEHWHQSKNIGETELCYFCIFSPPSTKFKEKNWIEHKPK